jgi:putative RNA 2'-phosphotransferase
VTVGPEPLTGLSRLLSQILRHEPWLYELELDDEGWVAVDDLLGAIRAADVRWLDADRSTLEQMVAGSSKRRHEIIGDRVRALYGHSLPGTLRKERGEPPAWLFHGTSPIAAEAIAVDGLQPMGRQFVHLSTDRRTAAEVAAHLCRAQLPRPRAARGELRGERNVAGGCSCANPPVRTGGIELLAGRDPAVPRPLLGLLLRLLGNHQERMMMRHLYSEHGSWRCWFMCDEDVPQQYLLLELVWQISGMVPRVLLALERVAERSAEAGMTELTDLVDATLTAPSGHVYQVGLSESVTQLVTHALDRWSAESPASAFRLANAGSDVDTSEMVVRRAIDLLEHVGGPRSVLLPDAASLQHQLARRSEAWAAW